MKDAMNKVRKFHELGNLPMFDKLNIKSWEDNFKLRMNLLCEEYTEYLMSEAKGDMVGIADSLADMIYIICGTAITYGIPLDKVFNEVHRSNLSKFNGKIKKRDDGKILKGDNYFLPEIEKILDKYGYEHVVCKKCGFCITCGDCQCKVIEPLMRK